MCMSTHELLLYYDKNCRYCIKVLNYLNSIKKTINMFDISTSDEEYVKLHSITGRYTVPCLMIDNKPFYESDDIIKWLENYFQNNK